MKVSVIMGSKSDLPTMKQCIEILEEFGIEHEVKIVSAHRTPTLMYNYSKELQSRGFKVVVAGAGGAAHLPGMVASLTDIPVIGVPVESKTLKGMDSLLSIVQMPGGVPVATMAIGGAKNAGLLAARIVATSDEKILLKIKEYRENMEKKVLDEQI